MTTLERWLPIKGYEGHYEVSNCGRIRSMDRDVKYSPRGRIGFAKRKGKILVSFPNKKAGAGYLCVSLWKDNKIKNKPIHRAVAEAFIPNPLGLPEINHIDSNTKNNAVDNLEWCNRRHNYKHSIIYGSRLAKITRAKAALIIETRKAGATYAQLAKQFNICPTTAHKAVNNRLVLLRDEQ